ncbi:MAG TPA: cation diffusion facilitator family transporter [Acidimicrobiia bacterium]|jgi:cobalt-zinc-cadmium efflux system protein|nr:cation transporter [Acidimicrobiia bacterium]HYJ24446.1 cation diffusion facilitator family transporter [Acidimicrobiia bacterium]
MTAAHTHVPRAGRRHLRPLTIAFGLVVAFMVVEAVAGYLTGSLALISDAGHMATDALGLGMALAAIVAADRASSGNGRTFGLYRLEIIAALANAVLLFAVAGYVLYEAIQRFRDPPEVATTPMLAVAVAGLVVNIIGWRLLRSGAAESLNVKGAYLEVVADLAGSAGVIVAALIMILTGWVYADPLFAALIGLFILPRAWRLGHQALRILVQAAPPGIDLDRIQSELGSIPGVLDVHDLHVWTLTSEMDVATVHLMTSPTTDPHPVLDRARDILQDNHGIAHATLQVEPDTHQGCSEVSW